MDELMMPFVYVKGNSVYAVMPSDIKGYRVKYRRRGSMYWLVEPTFSPRKTLREAQKELDEYADRLKLKKLED